MGRESSGRMDAVDTTSGGGMMSITDDLHKAVNTLKEMERYADLTEEQRSAINLAIGIVEPMGAFHKIEIERYCTERTFRDQNDPRQIEYIKRGIARKMGETLAPVMDFTTRYDRHRDEITIRATIYAGNKPEAPNGQK